MCGICGVLAYANNSEVLDESLMVRMSNEIVHRGPDDDGVYVSKDQRLGFGFRRLSIIDLSPLGHQPMCNEDGSLWIVFNGEIYNHAEHRAHLEQKGHVYRGQSDTETILHLYEEYGRDCVLHLRGIFAFAIWDEKRDELFVARDRVGVKPLYYTHSQGCFVFGSEIKSILKFPGVPRDIDEEALFHYLTFMVTPAPLTLFKGICKVPPGTWMVINQRGEIKEEKYWDAIKPGINSPTSESECIELVRDLLDESVQLRMMSDVPFGAFLSGGIDSSTNVALMAKHASHPINTFTVGFKDAPEVNELIYAKQISDQFSTNHHEVMIDTQDMLDYMPQLVHSQDEPIADPVCVPLYYVSKLAQDSGVKVVQVGEGADELFCGYPYFLRYVQDQMWWQRFQGIVPEKPLRYLYGLGAWGLQTAGKGFGQAEIFERRRRSEPTFWGGATVYGHADKAALLNVPFWSDKPGNTSLIVEKYMHHAQRAGLDFLGQMTYLELQQRLPELLLMRVDKITMSVSLEARVPFLDHKLIEQVLPIAQKMKILNQPKYLLKKVVEEWIPPEIIYRKKLGFPGPVDVWFQHIAFDVLEQSLLHSPLAKRGLFNLAFVEKMLSEQMQKKKDWSTHLWVLYNLNLWYAHWFENVDMA